MTENKLSFSYHRSLVGMHWTTLVALFLVLAGFVVRLINLTNPPLDFHAWRQLRSALIARSLYYQSLPDVDPDLRRQAIILGQGFDVLEPNIFEYLVSIGYHIGGGEYLWIARLLAIFFWVVGGVAVYLLASELTLPIAGLFSLGYYLLLPYGVIASRSFQPDPLMVMWLTWGCYALYHWNKTQKPGWCIAAGILSGLAVLTKVFAAFPVLLEALFLVFYRHKNIIRVLRDWQTWLTAILMTTIPSIYYLVMIGSRASEYLSDWVFGFSRLLWQPWFYIRWLDKVHALMDTSWVLVGLAGLFLVSGSERRVLLGMWLGYALIGLSVPSLIISHDYYNLPLIPILAISSSPIVASLLTRINFRTTWEKISLAVLFGLAVFYPFWTARTDLLRNDYHGEVIGWQKLANTLPRNASFIGLTHDYNMRLRYYGWIHVASWPHAADLEMNILAGGNNDPDSPVWKEVFLERTKGYDYFIVTLYSELDAQPMLAKILNEYPIIQGEGYTLYKLSGNP